MHLSIYLEREKLSYDDFGALIGVTGTSVYRYAKGQRRPIAKLIPKIIQATNNAVTANDFYDSPIKSNGKPHSGH